MIHLTVDTPNPPDARQSLRHEVALLASHTVNSILWWSCPWITQNDTTTYGEIRETAQIAIQNGKITTHAQSKQSADSGESPHTLAIDDCLIRVQSKEFTCLQAPI